LVNRCGLTTIPSGYRTAGPTATDNLPGVSPPIFVSIPAVRSNPDAWRPSHSHGKLQYQMTPQQWRYGSTTQIKPDAPPGTAVTGKLLIQTRPPHRGTPADPIFTPERAAPQGPSDAETQTETQQDHEIPCRGLSSRLIMWGHAEVRCAKCLLRSPERIRLLPFFATQLHC
jgi:hypothetical protein